MKVGKLFADGQELLIDTRIGRGGEGEVFSLRNVPGFAVKAYLPAIVKKREPKIRAMVASRLAHCAPMVAFPYQVVVDGKGNFVGFMMRLVEKHKEVHELQTPSSRQRHFPKADYRFIVRVAVNIARVFAQVHATGCIVGDINQRGILVSPAATVALIDADSFQVTQGDQRFLCVVGVPEYTPPELQGKSLQAVERTPDHDAFGLAVCLFQLLCMDRHPFSGRYTGRADMPLEKAIAEFRFAYSARNTGMVPPPGTVLLGDFTPAIRQLFETAFDSSHVGKRPSVSQWVSALEELESALRVCSKNRLHHFARNAAECPWCRMEGEYGRPLFLDTDFTRVHVARSRLDPTLGLALDLPALFAVINGTPIPSSISIALPFPASLPSPSENAKGISSARWKNPLRKIAGVGVILAAIIGFGNGLPGLVATLAVGFGIWLLFRSSDAKDDLLQRHQEQATAIKTRTEQLQRGYPIHILLQRRVDALAAIDEFQRLGKAHADIKNDYDKARRQKQLDDYLCQFEIRGARIPKLKSGDVASLASYGFATAFDAKRRDVEQAYGIGPVKASNIATWVRRIEANFRFQSAYTPEDLLNIKKGQNDIVLKQQGQEERIKKLVEAFRAEAQSFERWRASRDPELARLCQQLAQTEGDLQHVGMSAPSRPTIAPQSVSFRPGTQPASGGSTPRSATHPAQGVSCPQCNSTMVRRIARRGARAGKPFWGCSRYPSCTGTRPI